MKRIISLLVVAVAMTVAVGAQAQGYDTRGTGAVGVNATIAVVNASADSLIRNGAWLYADSTASVDRIAVRAWDGDQAKRHRFIGIALGAIPKGQVGTALTSGFHPRALMNGGVSAFGQIGLSAINVWRGQAQTDTLGIERSMGWLLKYNSDGSAAIYLSGPFGMSR